MPMLGVKEGMQLRRKKYKLAEVLAYTENAGYSRITQVRHNLAQSGRP